MDRKDCTETQCLYKGALYLLPLPKSEHKCFRNTEETNCSSETTDSTTYWYVTSYTYTAARTPNIRAFHKQSFNLAITNWITSVVTEWEGRIRNRGITGDWQNCFELATPHRGTQWLVEVEWCHYRRATKLTQLYWVVQGQRRQAMYVEHNIEWYRAREGRQCT
jgi:hypothetical protein